MTTKKKLIAIGVATIILLAILTFIPGGLKGKFLSSNSVYVDGEACKVDSFKCTDIKMCVNTFFSNGDKITDISGSKASAGDNSSKNVMPESSYLVYTIPDAFRNGDKINLVYDTRPCGTAGLTGTCTNHSSERYLILPITIGEILSKPDATKTYYYKLKVGSSKSAYFYARYNIDTRKVTAYLQYEGDDTDSSALSLELREISGVGSVCMNPLYPITDNWTKPVGFSPRICEKVEDKCSVRPTAFSIDSPNAKSLSRTVPVTFTASSASGDSYLIRESSSRPFAGNPDWERNAPTKYISDSDGLIRLYAWSKDAAGNVSTVNLSDTVTIDTQRPTITAVTSVKKNGSYNADEVIPIVIKFSEPIKVLNTSTPILFVGSGTVINTVYKGLDPTATMMTFEYRVTAGQNFSPLRTEAFTADITDDIGNLANKTLPSSTDTSLSGQNIIIDTISPPAPNNLDLQIASDSGISNTDNTTSDKTPSITVGCELNSAVKLYNNATLLASNTCTVASAGTITLTPTTALTDGTYTFTVKQTDIAGNISSASAPLSVTIDTVAPASPAITSPAASATLTTANPVIMGTAESESTVEVTLGTGRFTGIATNGTYSIPISTSLINDTYTVSANTTDVAGNISTSTMRDFIINVPDPICTGARPLNSIEMQGIKFSTISKPWKHDASSNGPYDSCSFQCNSGTTYNATNNTCVNNTTPLTAIATTTGTARVGQVLTAGVMTPSAATVTYQWRRSDASNGTYVNISGATAPTYTLLAADENKYITVVVTGTGAYTGTVTSSASAQVIGIAINGTCGAAAQPYPSDAIGYGNFTFCETGSSTPTTPAFPGVNTSVTWTCSGVNGGSPSATCTATKNAQTVTTIADITGTARVGQVLTAGVMTPSAATVTYQWRRSDASNGTYVNISGATASTYTLLAADENKYITVVVTGTGAYTGTVTSIASAQVMGVATYAVTYHANGSTGGTIPSAQTKTQGINLTLAMNSGSLVKIGYTFSGWNTQINGEGTNYTVGGNYTVNVPVILYAEWIQNPINGTCGAAAKPYPSDAIGYGNFTFCETGSSTPTTPAFPGVNTSVTWTCSGVNGGSPSATCTATKNAQTVTTIADITGTARVGQVLTAGAITPSTATVTYQWRRSDASNGTYVNISGATASTYTLLAADENKYITVVVTGTGAYTGTVTSIASAQVMGVATYAVTYHANGSTGGTIPSAQTKTQGINLTLAMNSGSLVKIGYTFSGWNTQINGEGTNYTVGGNYTVNVPVILYAEWIQNPINGTCGTAAQPYPSDAVGYGIFTFCETGSSTPTTPSFPGANTFVTWTCSGVNGGSTSATCTAKKNAQTPTAIADITGTARVGQVLTAGAITPSTATVTYQWRRSDTANGTYVNISGATASTYTLLAADENKYITVVVTGTGAYIGTVMSNASAQVIGVAINGTCGTAAKSYPSDAVGYGNFTFCETGSSTPTTPAFPGANTSVTWTCSGVNGGSMSATCTATKNAQTLTAIATTTGTARVGQTLTAGVMTPSAATVTYQWRRADAANGTYADISGAAISGATASTYTLLAADENKYITVVVTGTGAYVGTLTSSASAQVNAAVGTTAPTVVRVTSSKVNGVYRSGTIIPISVEFSKPVTVTGVPTLILETGTNDVTVPFKQKESDGKTLTFEYVVSDGNTSPDLNYVATNSLKLADATITIKDTATSVNANLTLPALSATESLAGNKSISIDTTRPNPPATPIVPQQTNISLSSIATSTFIATGNSMTINVACATGEKIKIYNGVSFSPLKTGDCVNNIVTLTLDLASQANYYNFFATVSDISGNESDYSPKIVVIKQQTVSNAPGVPDLDSLSDLGVSSMDNLTSESTLKFTVSCISGATVNLYDNVTLIGSGECVASTAQIIPIQPLSTGAHTLTAKQIVSGTTSAASSPLVVTIDTASLTVVLTRAQGQSESTTSPTIRFTATFSRPIDGNSFICSDVTVVNGTCTGVALLSGNSYTITVTAATQGQVVRVTIYSGRVQTVAGNLNSESTGVNTVTYGTVSATAECSTTLTRFTTSRPISTSLNGQILCKTGTSSSVSYNSSNLKWTYQCRGTDGSDVSCSVNAVLNAAPPENSVCDADQEEIEVLELPFGKCSLTNTSNLYYFYEYLDCLGIAEKSSCNKSNGCPQEAKRQELVYIADQLRGIPLDDNYDCQGSYTDTERGVASWVCEAAEKAQIAELISTTNTKFRPLDTMTRAEAYSVLMKSICIHPDTDYRNWQTKVAQEARELGFTVRTVSTFEPNKLILRQELYALAARIAEYKEENPETCDALPKELICE